MMPELATACLAAPQAKRVCRPRNFHSSSSSPAWPMLQFLISAEILVTDDEPTAFLTGAIYAPGGLQPLCTLQTQELHSLNEADQ